VTFTNMSTNITVGTCGAAWNWSFGDGGGATVPNPLYTYSKRGTYTVTLLVTNSAGSDDQIYQITVQN
jgi:PKD repeat protein